MRKFLKWGVIIFVGLIILASLMGDEEENSEVQTDTQPKKEESVEQVEENEESIDISWEIYNIEDISIASAERFEYHVVINDQVTPKQIKEIGEQIIEKAKRETPFNALAIGFYDYPEYIGSGYILGQAEVAPNGEWANAVNINTGDYSNMKVNWDIKEKDWDKRLTPKEAEVWGRWDEIWLENPDMFEDEITEQVAQEFDLTIKEVDSIAMKQIKWANQDLKK